MAPEQGSREQLIRDTIDEFKTEHGNHPASSELAAAVEKALAEIENPTGCTDNPPPILELKEQAEERLRRVARIIENGKIGHRDPQEVVDSIVTNVLEKSSADTGPDPAWVRMRAENTRLNDIAEERWKRIGELEVRLEEDSKEGERLRLQLGNTHNELDRVSIPRAEEGDVLDLQERVERLCGLYLRQKPDSGGIHVGTSIEEHEWPEIGTVARVLLEAFANQCHGDPTQPCASCLVLADVGDAAMGAHATQLRADREQLLGGRAGGKGEAMREKIRQDAATPEDAEAVLTDLANRGVAFMFEGKHVAPDKVKPSMVGGEQPETAESEETLEVASALRAGIGPDGEPWVNIGTLVNSLADLDEALEDDPGVPRLAEVEPEIRAAEAGPAPDDDDGDFPTPPSFAGQEIRKGLVHFLYGLAEWVQRRGE